MIRFGRKDIEVPITKHAVRVEDWGHCPNCGYVCYFGDNADFIQRGIETKMSKRTHCPSCGEDIVKNEGGFAPIYVIV
jgi:predicted RNA-binding Zn-ribbon protein involved in translation (DUF1610 family)